MLTSASIQAHVIIMSLKIDCYRSGLDEQHERGLQLSISAMEGVGKRKCGPGKEEEKLRTMEG